MLRHVFADSDYAGPKLPDTLKAIGRWTMQIVKRSRLHSRRIVIAARNLGWNEPSIIRRLRLEPRIAAPRLNPVATHTVFLCQHRSIHAISTAIPARFVQSKPFRMGNIARTTAHLEHLWDMIQPSQLKTGPSKYRISRRSSCEIACWDAAVEAR